MNSIEARRKSERWSCQFDSRSSTFRRNPADSGCEPATAEREGAVPQCHRNQLRGLRLEGAVTSTLVVPCVVALVIYLPYRRSSRGVRAPISSRAD